MKKIVLLLAFLLSSQVHAFTAIGSGQSNACGRGTGGPSPLTTNPLVQVWNNANELIDDGNAFIPVPDFGNPPWYASGANNMVLWFADAAADNLNEPVKVILVCKGLKSIMTWAEGGELYSALKRIYLSTGEPPADVFLWHQGESDKAMSACSYKFAFLSLLARMRADGLLAYGAPAIVGTIVAAGTDAALEAEFNSNLFDLALEYPDILYVNASGLPTIDSIHFTGYALRDLGIKYWEKYSQ